MRGKSNYNGYGYNYSKIEKEDVEEKKHRRAQFLIYKVLEEAEADYIGRTKRRSWLRIRVSKLKVKIGNRLRRFNKRFLSKINAHLMPHFKTCRRFFQPSTQIPVPRSLQIIN